MSTVGFFLLPTNRDWIFYESAIWVRLENHFAQWDGQPELLETVLKDLWPPKTERGPLILASSCVQWILRTHYPTVCTQTGKQIRKHRGPALKLTVGSQPPQTSPLPPHMLTYERRTVPWLEPSWLPNLECCVILSHSILPHYMEGNIEPLTHGILPHHTECHPEEQVQEIVDAKIQLQTGPIFVTETTYNRLDIPKTWITSGDMQHYMESLMSTHPSFVYIRPEIYTQGFYEIQNKEPPRNKQANSAHRNRMKVANNALAEVIPKLRTIREDERTVAFCCGQGAHFIVLFYYGKTRQILCADSLIPSGCIPKAQQETYESVCNHVLSTKFQWDVNTYSLQTVPCKQQSAGTCGYHFIANSFLLLHEVSCVEFPYVAFRKHIVETARANFRKPKLLQLQHVPLDCGCPNCPKPDSA